MKSFTREEFLEYVKGLNFEELEDVSNFVQEYLDHFQSIPEENVKEKDDAWEKYMMLMARFGSMFLAFTISVINFRKILNDEMSQEENRNSGSLED